MSLEDGLDERDVISIALWRNLVLRAELTRIDAALATLDEARRPANPQLSLMAPFGPVSAVAILTVPLESLWQMPSRTKAAAKDADMTGEAVLMRALDLVRDARVLHVELGLALDRVAVRRDLEKVAVDVARIAAVRSRTGEISPLEERMLSADGEWSVDASETARTDVSVARARLFAQLNLDDETHASVQAAFVADELAPPELAELVRVARAARPDAHAAQLAVEAATARAGWERSRMLNLSALAEAHWAEPEGPALRLGGRTEVPIFGANPGGRGRAQAEVERALALHELVARTAVFEVTEARARWVQATNSRKRFEAAVLPALEEGLEIATRSFEVGDDSYLVVLDALRRTGEARLRQIQLLADQRRALCDLERALGARLQKTNEFMARAGQDGGPG